VEEVRAQLGFGQLIGRGAEMSGEARDDRHVGLDGPLGVTAEMEVVDQALAQGGHGILSGKGEERIRAATERAINTPRPTRSGPNDYPPQAD
jgi:hypothetical protein